MSTILGGANHVLRRQSGILKAGGGASLLPLTARLAFGENSYGAQTGSISYLEYAWMYAGCRGWPTLGIKQARGGDRLTHLHDRWAPLDAVKASIYGTMNVENDLADAAVTNDAAGGSVLLARADSIIADARASGGTVILYKQPNTATAIGGKVNAVTAYNAGLDSRAASDVLIMDQRTYFDPQDATQSSDQVHPNKAKSAVALGQALGALIATQFTPGSVFGATGEIAGNFNANWNMGSAGTLTNASGATATQSAGVLRSDAARACRIITVSGTATADPTATGDIQLRFSTPHAGGTNTIGKAVACIAFIEVTNAAGNDPVGLATLQIQCAQSTGFGKTYVAANGSWHDGKKYQGPIGVFPTPITGQSLPANTDIIIRCLQTAVDIEIRVALVNVFYTDDVAYGPVTNASAIFTAGRPVLFALPTTTPSSGPLTVGGTLAPNVLARFIGGGLTRTFDAIRNGTTDVGDAVLQTAGAAAVPYTIVAGDSGQTLAIRNNASNSFGGGTATSLDTTALAVT